MSQIEPITATVRQFKELSGLGATSIYELIRCGEIQSITIGRRRLIVLASWHALLRSRLAAADCTEPAPLVGSVDGSIDETASKPLVNL